jgi:hypothetical protein
MALASSTLTATCKQAQVGTAKDNTDGVFRRMAHLDTLLRAGTKVDSAAGVCAGA